MGTIRLWLDDERRMPVGYTHWAKTADEAIAILSERDAEHCSLDHDLAWEHYEIDPGYTGDDEQTLDRSVWKEKTGYDVLLWMAATGRWCPDITIHTWNPAGRRDMVNLISNRAPTHVVFRVRPAGQ